MGRIGEVSPRTWQTADKNEAAAWGPAAAGFGDNDNFRIRPARYIAKYQINPAIPTAIAPLSVSIEVGQTGPDLACGNRHSLARGRRW